MSLPRRIAAFLTGLAVIAILIGFVLPWTARNGYAGPAIQSNYQHDRDATALFYTESDRTMEIMEKMP